MTSGQIYGVYFAWVIVMGALIYFFYFRLSTSHKWNSLVWFAYIFGACFVAQFLIVLVTMICAVASSQDSFQENALFT